MRLSVPAHQALCPGQRVQNRCRAGANRGTRSLTATNDLSGQRGRAPIRALEDALDALRRAHRQREGRSAPAEPADAEVAALERQLQHDVQEAWQTLGRLSEALRRRRGQAPTP